MQEDTYLGNKADPLSLNLYSYCYNNPIRYYDPTGHVVTQADIDRAYANNPPDKAAQIVKDIQKATDDWNKAKAAGNQAAMDKAHADADKARGTTTNKDGTTSGVAGGSTSVYKDSKDKDTLSTAQKNAAKEAEYKAVAKELGLSTTPDSPYKDIIDCLNGTGGFTSFTGVLDYNQSTGVGKITVSGNSFTLTKSSDQIIALTAQYPAEGIFTYPMQGVWSITSLTNNANMLYKTMDEAAEAWAIAYYALTDYLYMEQSSFIYMLWDGNKMLGYSYTLAIVGEPHVASGMWDGLGFIPENGITCGMIHSHPSETSFSYSDKSIARDNNFTSYVVVPGSNDGQATIKKFGDYRRVVNTSMYYSMYWGSWKESSLRTDITFKPLTNEEKVLLVEMYYSRWEQHAQNCNRFNCGEDKIWPKQ